MRLSACMVLRQRFVQHVLGSLLERVAFTDGVNTDTLATTICRRILHWAFGTVALLFAFGFQRLSRQTEILDFQSSIQLFIRHS